MTVCDSTIRECLIDICSDDGNRALLQSHKWPDFWVNCIGRFPKRWGKVKLVLLLEFPTYVDEQRLSQTLHMRNESANRFDINKANGQAHNQFVTPVGAKSLHGGAWIFFQNFF